MAGRWFRCMFPQSGDVWLARPERVAQSGDQHLSQNNLRKHMPSNASAAREFARRLLDYESVRHDGPTAIAAAQYAAECVWVEVSQWTGVDGCHALLTRAVALAKAENPALLRNAKVGGRARNWLEGIGDNASTNGAGAAVEGVESILTELIELLGRLVGEQIAINLLQPCLPENAGRNARARSEETA